MMPLFTEFRYRRGGESRHANALPPRVGRNFDNDIVDQHALGSGGVNALENSTVPETNRGVCKIWRYVWVNITALLKYLPWPGFRRQVEWRESPRQSASLIKDPTQRESQRKFNSYTNSQVTHQLLGGRREWMTFMVSNTDILSDRWRVISEDTYITSTAENGSAAGTETNVHYQ